MDFKTIVPDKSVALFVKSILIFEDEEVKQNTILPFFADGYPGLIFQETSNGLLVQPHNKMMPAMFLYGQTIHPIELVMSGAYKLVVFQLYPFVLKSFFDVVPKDLNNDCYNLARLHSNTGVHTIEKLGRATDFTEKTEIISSFLYTIFQVKQKELDFTISRAIQQIISKKGQLIIGDLCNELHLTERTFERRFLRTVGVTAKQFSRIIQFQQSLQQLTVKDFTILSDIVYANGYADQSHFIKVFKAFTGKTPLAFHSNK